MGRKRFRLGITSGLTALTLMLVACGGEGDGSGDGGKVELRMLVNITPNLTEKFWNGLVAPFEADHPDIDVKIEAPVATGVADSLTQLLASGDPPDVVEHQRPTEELRPLLMDLSKYEFAAKGPMADQYALDGKYYMAAVGQQLQTIMFYNKKAFADAGIKAPPATLDELEADLDKLKQAGWTPIQTGGDWLTVYGLQAMSVPTVLAQHPDWYARMRSGELSWSKTFGPYAERYARWAAEGYVPEKAVSTKYADAEAQFIAGKTAIYPMGSWFAAAAASAGKTSEFGVFAVPGESAAAPAMGAGAAAPYSILKATKHADAAVKLVEYLTTDQKAVSEQLKADANFRPGHSYATDELGKALQAIMDATPAKSFVPTGDGFGDQAAPPGYQAELNRQVQGLLIDKKPEKLAKALDAWWDSNR